jgi:ribose-phosphate pyrophosphokinase
MRLTAPRRVTAIADKLGVDFALIHRERKRGVVNAPETMDVLVGHIEGRVLRFPLARVCGRY